MAIKQEIFRHTVAQIHLDHLAHNFRNLKSMFPSGHFICPMVKANAYGHGDVEVALRLQTEGCQQVGVGLIEEGTLLRQNGFKNDILVYGIFDGFGAEQVAKWSLTPVISTWEQIKALESVRHRDASQKLSLHLKFDTGMHRLGFPMFDAQKLFSHFENHSSLKVTGICTHLANGEDAHDPQGKSAIQIGNFSAVEKIFASLAPVSHALNSAGLLNFWNSRDQAGHPSEIHKNLGIRPGLLLYGVIPPGVSTEKLQSHKIEFKPVMTLKSQIVRFLQLAAGESVSYGGTWTSQRPSIIGVIPMGYADGYHRLLSNRSQVLVKGKLAPQVGNVCMDYIMVDLTGIVLPQEAKMNIPTEAYLFGTDSMGNSINVCELAQKGQTIPWEILTSIGERVPRIFIPDVL